MTKKIKGILLIIMIGSVLLTGCGNTIVELTPEESAVISEYAVGLLLKYDKNYKSRILSDNEIAAAEEKQRIIEEEARQREEKRAEEEELARQADSQRKDGSGKEQEVLQNVDIAQFLGIDNFTINYQSYEVTDSYPAPGDDDMYFSMDAAQGSQLLVLHFDIMNQSEDEQTCDILSKSVRSGVKINGGQWENVLVTMLQNDFAGFQDTIEAGNSRDAVIVAELTQEELTNIESIAWKLVYGDESVKIGLE